jgi:hypothetical protein
MMKLVWMRQPERKVRCFLVLTLGKLWYSFVASVVVNLFCAVWLAT